MEPSHYHGIARKGKIELEPGAQIPEGARVEVLFDPNVQAVRSNPEIMGGDTCIRDTRIPVWLLVAHKQSGRTDSEILASYPGLNAADLLAAWDHYASHSAEIEGQRRAHDEAA